MKKWWIYQGTGKPHDGITDLPPPPKWREYNGEIIAERTLQPDPQLKRRFGDMTRGQTFQASEKEIDLINTALYLRRPLLVTGKPGSGKSSLAYAVAHELKLGQVLRWPITSRSTLEDALYRYDAIGRLQDAQFKGTTPDIGQFIRLGPLGTALLPTKRPRVLLIDEIDKSDIDLPHDLLNIFEEGEFEIQELARLSESYEQIQVYPHDGQDKVMITKGRVICKAFPLIVLTSNGERELPPPFLRRCLRLDIEAPTPDKLAKIVEAHFGQPDEQSKMRRDGLIHLFLARREKGDLATDQLLNAIYLTMQGINLDSVEEDKDHLINTVLRHLRAIKSI